MKTINNKLIRSFRPCYDPSTKGIPNDENLSVMEWVDKYRGVIRAEDILWLLLRKEFYDDRQLRLFSVWCAREALKFVSNPSQISIDACNVAEKFAKGEATKQDLYIAMEAARAAADDVSRIASKPVAYASIDVTRSAIWDSRKVAMSTAMEHAIASPKNDVRERQLDYLVSL